MTAFMDNHPLLVPLLVTSIVLAAIVVVVIVDRRAKSQWHTKVLIPPHLAIAQLFMDHGVQFGLEGETVTIPGAGLWIRPEISAENTTPDGVGVQLDVLVRVPTGETIVESFAGVGVNRTAAINDSLMNFAANSFHVILAAFVNERDEQTTCEEWTVGGRRKRVFLGNAGVRGNKEVAVQVHNVSMWYPRFEELVKAHDPGPGLHWVRFLYAQVQNDAVACEALLDNKPWEDLQREMSALPWAKSEQYYSVRLFLIMTDPKARA